MLCSSVEPFPLRHLCRQSLTDFEKRVAEVRQGALSTIIFNERMSHDEVIRNAVERGGRCGCLVGRRGAEALDFAIGADRVRRALGKFGNRTKVASKGVP